MTGVWRLPGYVVEKRLGVGGSGQVWRARERVSGEAVAVKLLPAVGRDQLAVVRSEAAMLSALDHPHLLHLHEVVPCKAGLALVVDLAAGGSLAALLNARGRLSAGEVVTALAPIGAALAYAHNAGVVHGDVSAANVLFTDIGLPLLADLGVARLAGDDAPVSSTPAYIDPAVAVGGVPAASSDVFMLGAIALHALTGDPPWPGTSAAEVLAAAAAGDIGDVGARQAAAGVPDAVATVVSRALEFEADRRPTAAEFALDLRHAAEPVAVELTAGRIAGDAVGGADPAFTHIVRPPARRTAPSGIRARVIRSPRLTAVAAGAVVALAGVAALLWWPRDSTQQREQSLPTPRPSTAVASLRASSDVPVHTSPTPPTSTAPGALTMTSAGATQVLVSLDATRARAFALRSPTLLDQVYASGALRTQDAATIARIVPSGCGLVGVHTAYSDVSVLRRTKTQVTVRARATLQPSTLQCSDTPAAKASGAQPAVLEIVLVRSGGHYLIASITR